MVMKMNKKNFIEELMKKTGKSENECIVVNEILENHFIIGHNNKDKIKKDFIEKMQVTEKDADNLYNICAELIVKGIFK